MPNPTSVLYLARNMARFAPLLTWILKWEGSVYTNDPDDHGGPTRYGVIQTRYDQYRKDTGKPTRSVRYIELPEVTSIYARYYWNVIDGDTLPAPYDLALFNVAVNSGTGRAAQFRGEVEKAHPGADALTLARAVCDRYERFYRAIAANPGQSKWLKGWLNRLDDCRQEIEEAAIVAVGVDSWDVFIGSDAGRATLAWANPKDGNKAYVPLRSFLERFFEEKDVTKNLSLREGDAYWAGKKMPLTEVQRPVQGGDSETWVPVRELADWLGLDVLVDGKQREIVLVRPAGAAKAEG